MPRTDVNVRTPDGECPSIIVTPDGEGPWPAVILYMDAGGVRPAMVTMAERLAAMGYVAFLPEMYYRSAPYEPFDMATVFTDAAERQRLFGLITSLTTGERGIRRRRLPRPPGHAARGGRHARGCASAPPGTAWAAASRWCRRPTTRPDRCRGVVPRRSPRDGRARQPAPPGRSDHRSRLRRRCRGRRVVHRRRRHDARRGPHRGRRRHAPDDVPVTGNFAGEVVRRRDLEPDEGRVDPDHLRPTTIGSPWVSSRAIV